MNPHHNKKWNSNKFSINRIVTVVVLLALVVIGLASTTFATFVPGNKNPQEGSLVAQIMTSVVNRSKEDIADTSADTDVVHIGVNNDLSDTSANVDIAPS